VTKVEKLTVEIRKTSADRLRRLRQRLREKDALPVTQQMIVEYLIDEAEHEALYAHFEARMTMRLGVDVEELRTRRHAAYIKNKKRIVTR
jgi:hypothetical protein